MPVCASRGTGAHLRMPGQMLGSGVRNATRTDLGSVVHEFALAQAVIDAAVQAAERGGITRITKIVVGLGELQQIERECFDFALKEVIPLSDASLAQTQITIETEPARFRCRPCEHAFTLADARPLESNEESEAIHFIPELAHAFVRCPRCQSPDFEVLAGRGVTLQSLEGDQ
jgi:hydrogenase nickel incorporation protein HypA/HybF